MGFFAVTSVNCNCYCDETSFHIDYLSSFVYTSLRSHFPLLIFVAGDVYEYLNCVPHDFNDFSTFEGNDVDRMLTVHVSMLG